ncbi:MAG: hypothetical protein GY950_19950, partial [bacterium]|nr:hypothetical protein [bacterium]
MKRLSILVIVFICLITFTLAADLNAAKADDTKDKAKTTCCAKKADGAKCSDAHKAKEKCCKGKDAKDCCKNMKAKAHKDC